VVLALVAGVVGTTWGMVRAISEGNHKETALEAARRSEREARESLWESLYQQARARRFSRQLGQRFESLDALEKAAAIRPDDRLRDEAIAALAVPDVRSGPTWHAWPAGHNWGPFDADYRLYSRINERGVITVRRIADNQEIRKIDRGEAVRWERVLLSPDGNYLVAAEYSTRNLHIWRVADGEQLLHEKVPRTWGWAFTSDSRYLAVGHNGVVMRFDLTTGREVNRWELFDKSEAHSLAFHPDNRRLAIGYRDGVVVSVYDSTTGENLANLPDEDGYVDQIVAWHPDGEHLAFAGGLGERVQIWNVSTRRHVTTLVGHTQRVTVLSFHPDGRLLCTCSWDGSVRLWEPSTGRQLLHFTRDNLFVSFSRDGRYLGVAGDGEHAHLLEVNSSPEYRTISTGRDGCLHHHDLSPDGQLLALSTVNALRLLHLRSGRELAALPPGQPRFLSNSELLTAGRSGVTRWPIRSVGVNELSVGPPRTLPWAEVPGTLWVTDNAVPEGKRLVTRMYQVTPTLAERNADGRTLAVLSEGGEVAYLVDLASETLKPHRFRHTSASYIAYSGDGRWVATGGWHTERVRLWNTETGKMAHEWPVGRAKVYFTPDSRTLILCTGNEFTFWDVETLQQLRRIGRDVTQYPGHVAFSPDGRLMALEIAPGIVHLRDAATDRIVAKLEDPHGDRATWMAFSPDGTQLVVNAGYSRAVHVWDLRAVRQRLKTMGLDWEWPEFSPAAPPEPPGQRYAGPAWKIRVDDPQGGEKLP
jgi:WD40 repeat protein